MRQALNLKIVGSNPTRPVMEQTPVEYKESVEQLIELYEGLEESVEGFMAEQDVDMKLTALRSMQRDIEQIDG